MNKLFQELEFILFFEQRDFIKISSTLQKEVKGFMKRSEGISLPGQSPTS